MWACCEDLFSSCFGNKTSQEDIEEPQTTTIQGKGLPNVGLNCHLNTVIQLLYSMDKMRVSIKNSKKQLSKALTDVFNAMDAKAKTDQKKVVIQKLGKTIALERDDFKLNQQNDVTHVLGIILERLMDEDQKNKNYFEVKWQQTCKCRTMTICEIMSKKIDICADCGENMKAKMVQSPPYLIVFNNDDKQIQSEMKFPKKQSFQAYSLISMSEYTGNHYLCYRYDGKNMYRFNDDRVSLFEGDINKIRSSKIVIYKKIEEPVSLSTHRAR